MPSTLVDDQAVEQAEKTTTRNGQAPVITDLPGTAGGNGHRNGRRGFPGGSGGGGARKSIFSNSRVAIWFLLASITMLFGGFTSTVLVRRIADDWNDIPLPNMVIASTVVLLLSGLTIEVARRRLRRGGLEGSLNWLMVTAAGGILFVVGQWLAWQEMLGQGILFQSSIRSAFIYMLMGVHAVHVIGGVVGMAIVYYKVTRLRPAVASLAAAGPNEIQGLLTTGHQGPKTLESMNVFSTYWHFMAGLWVYLLILLFVS